MPTENKTRKKAAGTAKVPQIKKASAQARFLKAVSEVGDICFAAKRSRVHRASHYRWMHEDKDYEKRFTVAFQQGVDVVESEAYRRAMKGTEEPMVSAGVLVCTKRVFSDGLLQFLLRAHRPEKFRERFDHKHSGEVKLPGVLVAPAAMSLDEWVKASKEHHDKMADRTA